LAGRRGHRGQDRVNAGSEGCKVVIDGSENDPGMMNTGLVQLAVIAVMGENDAAGGGRLGKHVRVWGVG